MVRGPKQGIESCGFKAHGGKDSPYVYVDLDGRPSWEVFSEILEKAQVRVHSSPDPSRDECFPSVAFKDFQASFLWAVYFVSSGWVHGAANDEPRKGVRCLQGRKSVFITKSHPLSCAGFIWYVGVFFFVGVFFSYSHAAAT